ncbi:MAG TPA: crossover junction endodeoxyribonuclease RuvC [Chthonomonadales bacterium]|nr:crossover junction endodeoxyribonuclease RuvC [Chthonomonadales bacterium]
MIILGVDPGTATTGYGFIQRERGKLVHLASGVVRTDKSAEAPDRLLTIYSALNRLIDLHEPDVLATERLFFSSNVTNALQVGRTVGIILLMAAQRGLPWMEYRPSEVKMAVVGYGSAEKSQVQFMVQQLLHLGKPPKPDDAADALAIAICHANTANLAVLRSGAN